MDFNGAFVPNMKNCNSDYSGKGKDQLKYIIDMIKMNLIQDYYNDAWNPVDLDKMALPPVMSCANSM